MTDPAKAIIVDLGSADSSAESSQVATLSGNIEPADKRELKNVQQRPEDANKAYSLRDVQAILKAHLKEIYADRAYFTKVKLT